MCEIPVLCNSFRIWVHLEPIGASRQRPYATNAASNAVTSGNSAVAPLPIFNISENFSRRATGLFSQFLND